MFVCPDKVSQDKRDVLKAYGAEVVVCPTAVPPDHPDSYYSVARRLVGEKIDGDEASVQSRVVTPKGSEVGLEYRLYRAADRWAVYDIYVDGISLVGSYKAQFNRIIQRGSFADLIKQLREKVGS